MKRKFWITARLLVTAATMIFAASCGQGSKAQGNKTQKESESTSVMELCGKVLRSELEYFDVELQKNMFLNDYWTYFSENVYGGPMQINFTVVDMDEDGVSEVVIMYDPGELKVFRVEGGTVYGYDFSYRALMNLKKDGTFSWSNDAYSDGIGRQTFSGTHTETIELANNGNQEKKEDVDWMELTEENVRLKIKD